MRNRFRIDRRAVGLVKRQQTISKHGDRFIAQVVERGLGGDVLARRRVEPGGAVIGGERAGHQRADHVVRPAPPLDRQVELIADDGDGLEALEPRERTRQPAIVQRNFARHQRRRRAALDHIQEGLPGERQQPADAVGVLRQQDERVAVPGQAGELHLGGVEGSCQRQGDGRALGGSADRRGRGRSLGGCRRAGGERDEKRGRAAHQCVATNVGRREHHRRVKPGAFSVWASAGRAA